MINILFIHQSAEMYGSDKTLLLLLKNMDRSRFNPTVILPSEGVLKIELEKLNVNIVVAPVLKLYRKMFTPQNLYKFIKDINLGIKKLDELNKKHHFDIVYSNTLAVLLGLIYAKKRKIKHIWHVHEIIESPKIFTKLFSTLLCLKVNNKIVYNSIATKNFWNVNNKITVKSSVIWNGLESSEEILSDIEKAEIRRNFFKAKPNDIIIALVGRISRWKGQLILLDSFVSLNSKYDNIKLIFIGSSPPNQEKFQEKLNQEIEKNSLIDKVIIIPFQDCISKFWQSIDIAAVPSTEPEPFGLVAVEAMLQKKPVVGSNHGGLTEIIIHNETGFLVEPNDQQKLAEALSKLIENPSLRNLFGEAGYKRALNEFSIKKYVDSFEKLFLEI